VKTSERCGEGKLILELLQRYNSINYYAVMGLPKEISMDWSDVRVDV
jgi:hypothetical protein